MRHSISNGADTSVLFFRLAVLFICMWKRILLFLHFAVKIDIRWMNRHIVSLSVGKKTYFLMAFHAILRKISNHCLCAISSREQHMNKIEATRVLLITGKEYSQQSSRVRSSAGL